MDPLGNPQLREGAAGSGRAGRPREPPRSVPGRPGGGGLTERDEALSLAEEILDLSTADQTEVVLAGGRTALTRFANSAIHQNVVSEDVSLILRVVLGKQIGVARTNRTDLASAKETLATATRLAKAQKPLEDFVSLPEGGPVAAVPNFSPRTRDSTPEERAETVKEVIAEVGAWGAEKTFGALEATTVSQTVVNSLGTSVYDEATLGHLVVSAIHEADGEKGYGWGTDLHVDISQLDPMATSRAAGEKAVRSIRAKRVEPGEYTVILEDEAVSTLVFYLSYITFSALAYQEGRSYISDKLGERVTGEGITLWDEGTRPTGLPRAFDSEGVPKRKTTLVEEGIARSVVYDSYTAGREGRASTGHALTAPNPFGPLAANPFLQPGDASLEEMVEETKRGLYITRFHYANAVNPTKAILTGMTRDGTFLVEDGEVVGPVRNLRFTQGIMEALAEASLIGRDWRSHRLSSWLGFGATTVPPLRIDRFRFTGITEF
ncbi:MAG: TldD/PmbA family protein [Thermoplasmata archaeon]